MQKVYSGQLDANSGILEVVDTGTVTTINEYEGRQMKIDWSVGYGRARIAELVLLDKK